MELLEIKPEDFYTREELIQLFPKRKFFIKRHTFMVQQDNCIYENILVDLTGEIIPEKLLASMLLYVYEKERICSDADFPIIINTYQTAFKQTVELLNKTQYMAILITLLLKSQRKMSCICHIWLAALLGGKKFKCVDHNKTTYISGNHQLFSIYKMDTKTSMSELVNWVNTQSKIIIPYIMADNSNIIKLRQETINTAQRLKKVLDFFSDFCDFDKSELDYLLDVINIDMDMTDIPSMNPNILPEYLQEKYKSALMGTTNAKGECSTCYLKQFTKVNCILHSVENIKEHVDTSNLNECGICCDNKSTHVAVPCGHAYCGACIGKIYKDNKLCAYCKRTMNFPIEILWG